MSQFALMAIYKSYDLKIWSKLFPHWKYQPQTYEFIWKQKVDNKDLAWILWFLIHIQESKEKLAELGLYWKLPKNLIKKIIFVYQSLPHLKALNKVEAVDVAIFLSQPHGRIALKVFRMMNYGKLKKDWEQRLSDGESFFKGRDRLPQPLITGDDLIHFGMTPGPKIAKALKDLYRNQLKFKVEQKEELLKKLTK